MFFYELTKITLISTYYFVKKKTEIMQPVSKNLVNIFVD